MKKIGFILIFLLVFLFFPFPKNVGPQNKPDLKSVTSSVETTVKNSEFSPLSLLPAPSSGQDRCTLFGKQHISNKLCRRK